jgi:hypothetical protein
MGVIGHIAHLDGIVQVGGEVIMLDDDDEFVCCRCEGTFDIEQSMQEGGKHGYLVCEFCYFCLHPEEESWST